MFTCHRFFHHIFALYRVSLSKDQTHGKAFGRLVWRGVSKDVDSKVCTPYKKQWRLVSVPNYKTFKGTSDDVFKLVPPGHSGVAVPGKSHKVPDDIDQQAATSSSS